MKFKTKGLTMAAVSVLAMGAMVSTGFATWVITGNSTDGADATIGVDTKVKYVDIEQLTEDEDLVLYFGPNAADNAGWLKGGGTATEDLVAQVSFAVKGTPNGKVKVTSLSFVETSESGTPFQTAANEGLISDLPEHWATSAPGVNETSMQMLLNDTTYLVKDSEFNLSNATPGTAKLTFKLRLNWGSEFGSSNPLDYYNSISSDSLVTSGVTVGQEALSNLTSATFANLANAKFTLSFTLESIPS